MFYISGFYLFCSNVVMIIDCKNKLDIDKKSNTSNICFTHTLFMTTSSMY